MACVSATGIRFRLPEIELTLAHSPDADDVAMWWPIDGSRVDRAIDTTPFRFRLIPEDVQRLNELAGGRAPHDITAISAATYPRVARGYRITSVGGSFGEGYGPKLVVRDGVARSLKDPHLVIATPGAGTTANMVLTLMLGAGAFEARPMPFHLVADAVRRGETDAGLLIHEAQLTAEREGLLPVADLGVWWREQTGLPLPLGLNVVKRDLDTRLGPGTLERVTGLLSASAAYASEHRTRTFAVLRALPGAKPEWNDEALLGRYLDMYMSKMTLDMGERGRRALAELYSRARASGLIASDIAIDVIGGGQ